MVKKKPLLETGKFDIEDGQKGKDIVGQEEVIERTLL